MKFRYVIIFLVVCLTFSRAQELLVNRIDPPNWWVGMNWNKVKLMVYGQNLFNIKARFNSELIKVVKIHQNNNLNYAFIDIEIDPQSAPGDYQLEIFRGSETVTLDFPVLERVITDNQ